MNNILKDQYEYEKKSAIKLLNANRKEREHLYTSIYEEFYKKYSHHRDAERNEAKKIQLQLLEPYIDPNYTFLEIGGGNLSLSKEIANIAKQVISLEASKEDHEDLQNYPNLRVHIANLPPYGLQNESIDLAYSCHFIEHIHPEDALEHVSEIHKLLCQGGSYICITPNRIYGPHDVSRTFDKKASGLHLKEYSHYELTELFKNAGFANVKLIPGIARTPTSVVDYKNIILENIIDKLPFTLKQMSLEIIGKLTATQHPFRPMEQIVLIAYKEK